MRKRIVAACAAMQLLAVVTAGAQIREVEVTGGRVSGVVTNGIAASSHHSP